MAYDPNKKNREVENPYEAIVGGVVGAKSGISGSPVATAGQQESAPPVAPAPAGPSAGGHINFDQIQGANEGTSKREADKMQASAQAKGQAVKTGLTGVQQDFASQVRTGGMGAPDPKLAQWAQQADTGVEWGKTVKDANFASPNEKATGGKTEGNANVGQSHPQYPTLVWDGMNYVPIDQWDGKSHAPSRKVGAQDSITETGVGLRSVDPTAPPSDNPDAANPELSAKQNLAMLKAGAAQEYGGPESLSDLDAYGQLLKDAGAVKDEATAFSMGNEGLQGMGLNRLDAALVGGSGRRGFEDFANEYSGIRRDVLGANAASMGLAAAQKKKMAADADAYQQLLDQFEGRRAEDQALEDARQAHGDAVLAGAEKKRDDKTAYDAAVRSSKEGVAGVRNVLHDVAEMTSPSAWVFNALGEKTPLDAGTEWFGQQFLGDDAESFNAGNMSDAWGDDDADVFASMSAADWRAFNQMKYNDQKAFIEQRKAELRGGK